jgi:hypothetical protein
MKNLMDSIGVKVEGKRSQGPFIRFLSDEPGKKVPGTLFLFLGEERTAKARMVRRKAVKKPVQRVAMGI